MKQRKTERTAVKQRAENILIRLKNLFPDARMQLNFSNQWELMVAVQLSAQCTDKKVNEVTPKLFARYADLKDYAEASPHELEMLIYQTGFYRNKSRNIIAAAQLISSKFHGKLPMTMDEMLTIPGVARKTANVVLGNAYGVVEGIAVDTHVKRLAQKFGLTDGETALKIEQDLMNLYEKSDWFMLTYYFIEFGRKYCPARKHDHRACEILLGIFQSAN